MQVGKQHIPKGYEWPAEHSNEATTWSFSQGKGRRKATSGREGGRDEGWERGRAGGRAWGFSVRWLMVHSLPTSPATLILLLTFPYLPTYPPTYLPTYLLPSIPPLPLPFLFSFLFPPFSIHRSHILSYPVCLNYLLTQTYSLFPVTVSLSPGT